jgi:hypothetical protein
MACPYFYPVEPRGGSAMLPLGESWSGVCRATGGETTHPEDAALRQWCNLGYARGQCPRFPSGDGGDAVRFTIAGHQGDTVSIYYVVERDHYPFAHGAGFPQDETLRRQAEAYVDSYLRRKKEL